MALADTGGVRADLGFELVVRGSEIGAVVREDGRAAKILCTEGAIRPAAHRGPIGERDALCDPRLATRSEGGKVSFHPVYCDGVQPLESSPQERGDLVEVDRRQDQGRKGRRRGDPLCLARGRQALLRLRDPRRKVGYGLQGAEIGDGKAASPFLRDCAVELAEIVVVLLDLGDLGVDGCAERDALSSDDQLVQVLPVLGRHLDPGAHVLRDEEVIEDDDVWRSARPSAPRKDRRAPPPRSVTTCGGGAPSRARSRIGAGSPVARERRMAPRVVLPRAFSA